MVDESHGNGLITSSHGSHEKLPIKTNHNNNNNINNENPTTTNSNNNNSKEQDKFLPIANVGRIMKKVIPTPGKISKEAKETVQECVSEFISFITGEASEKCQHEKRKTINGDDIIWSINTLGFEDYVKPLKVYLKKLREIEDEKPAIPKQQQHRSSSDQSPSQQQQQQQLQIMHHHQQQLPDHPHLRHHLDHQHQLIDQQSIMDQKPIIDQKPSLNDQNSMIGGAHSGGLAPFPRLSNVYSPQPATSINPHHHHHQQPPPPPPSFVGADQALITLPNFLPSNSLQKTYHQHPEQINSVGHW